MGQRVQILAAVEGLTDFFSTFQNFDTPSSPVQHRSKLDPERKLERITGRMLSDGHGDNSDGSQQVSLPPTLAWSPPTLNFDSN